jgi:hypothetical protein
MPKKATSRTAWLESDVEAVDIACSIIDTSSALHASWHNLFTARQTNRLAVVCWFVCAISYGGGGARSA